MVAESRVGIGYDVHPFVQGRRLVLGGVEIHYPMGLSGWSDADVLTHALMDALLGAAGLGDIGSHFPPGEAEYRDISSLDLLGRVCAELKGAGWQVVNVDAVILLEQPRIKDFILPMREKLAGALGIQTDRVSVKASTSERLGFAGRGEGAAAWTVALIERGKTRR